MYELDICACAVLKALNRQSLNSRYRIDPKKNDGLDYAFQETVHGAARQKLPAGDCDQCRGWLTSAIQYYEARGPTPPRLKAPLWRSPEADKSPTHQQRVHKHKERISRHRSAHAAPKTPPSYWDIGFPDTVKVERINRAANGMHKAKEAEIEAEIAAGEGIWRRNAKGKGKARAK
ncbi:SAE2 domain-containing protein [Mycena chlorophos]|uniref:SAE2 domain-containing protein n=1 Tax=Mycena chlorophos TaxID=658473 RepID=A0A8H6T447_MYCCL|nr:SAE2 domain-containing protein [Mycena chlorophos]